MAWLVDEDILARVRRIELPWSRHGIDPYGIDQVQVARMFTALGFLYHRYFDVEAHGLVHVPARGRAMLVGNHSGGWALDAMMVLCSCFFEPEPPRLAQGMAEKFMNRLPFASLYTSRTGNFTGLPEHAVRLLEEERLLMVFPEGARGTAKLYGDRHTLVEFGTGFMRLALQTQTPIIPFAFLGGGEAIPTVMNLYKLGRLLRMPYIPVTPYLLPLPRPVPLYLRYGEPLRFEGTGTEEDEVVQRHVDTVKDHIAELMEDGRRARGRHGEDA